MPNRSAARTQAENAIVGLRGDQDVSDFAGGSAAAVTFDDSGLIVVTGADVQAALEAVDAAEADYESRIAALEGAGGGSGASLVIQNDSQVLTASYANTDLVFAVDASSRYWFRVFAYCTGVTGNEAINMTFAVPAGATIDQFVVEPAALAIGAHSDESLQYSPQEQDNGIVQVVFEGVAIIGVTAGDVAFQAKRTTAGTFQKGSNVLYAKAV